MQTLTAVRPRFSCGYAGVLIGAGMLDKLIPVRDLVQRVSRRLFPPKETLEGYQHPEVVEVVFQKTLAYEPREAVKPEIQGASTVLDFGGGCGLHYKEAKSQTVRWAVVETPAMVKRASELTTDRLRFFTAIATASDWLGNIDIVHSDGALHFTDEPEETVRQLCQLRAPRMLWYRMYLSKDTPERIVQVSHLVDNGPGKAPSSIKNKTVKYPYTKITEAAFIAAHEGYLLSDRGADWFQFSINERG